MFPLVIRNSLRRALLLAAVVPVACRDDSGWTITEQRSAAGIPHIVNLPPATGIQPTWSIEPDLSIGSVEGGGPSSFGSIKGMVVLPDERVAVLDAQAQELRIFAADGQHLHTFGRKGQGPGELSDANGVVLGLDGLLRVNDPGNSRLSFFHPDSGFSKSVQLDVKMFGYIWEAVVDTANHLWEQGLVLGASDRSYVWKGYDAQGNWIDTIPQPRYGRDNPRGVYSYRTPTGGGMMTVPFWPWPARTLDPRRIVWSKPSRDNDYRIARITLTGDTTLVFESRRPAIPVTAAERDSSIAAARKSAGTDLDWSQIPNEKPIVTQLFVAADGDVWVKVTSDSLTTFDLFGSDGRYKGTAVTSLRMTNYRAPIVRQDRFWAVVLDEFDVSHVIRGRLVPFSLSKGRRTERQ